MFAPSIKQDYSFYISPTLILLVYYPLFYRANSICSSI